jgi:hypothetical protein
MSASVIHALSFNENIRDQVVPVLLLLQSTESHLCARDVLLWVLEVLELLFMLLYSCK